MYMYVMYSDLPTSDQRGRRKKVNDEGRFAECNIYFFFSGFIKIDLDPQPQNVNNV